MNCNLTKPKNDQMPRPIRVFGARLFVENPFVEYDCKSNTTLGRKKRRIFFYERRMTLGRKNRPSVVLLGLLNWIPFWNAFPALHDGALTIA